LTALSLFPSDIWTDFSYLSTFNWEVFILELTVDGGLELLGFSLGSNRIFLRDVAITFDWEDEIELYGINFNDFLLVYPSIILTESLGVIIDGYIFVVYFDLVSDSSCFATL
jgi:hypothetical protein